VSDNTALKQLHLSGNQITKLDVSHNDALEFIWLSNMESLNEVCVWEMPFPPDGVEIDTSNSPNVYFTTDCASGG
jgi:Leucine-rich repeat (LRR) protein